MYKALITDVDGTLVINRPDAIPTARVRQAISKAQKLIHICVATSRPLFIMDPIFNSVNFSGPCIVSGGTQIYDATTKKVVWEKPLEIEDFWKVIKIILPHEENILINAGGKDDHYAAGYTPHKPFGICVDKISMELADILVDEISAISGVHVSKVTSHTPGKVAIDVTHVQATKQHGVYEVTKLLDIDPKDVIGVGDEYNDFPLLMACGLKVAMGNAPEELKAIADYIAPSVSDDGLADVIEKFVLAKQK